MTKFNLKEHIAKNQATFFGSLTEGQFSWMTQDTGQQIGSEKENTIPVYMFDNKGRYYYEKNYDGYGDFGGKDYYELLAQMNGYARGDRMDGIDMAFGKMKTPNGGPVLFPALVTKPNEFDYRTHDFTKEAETDPNQSWYASEEEEDFIDQNDEEVYGSDDNEEELDESKTTNTKMKKSELKDKIKEMILKEMEDEKVVDVNDETPESEEDFLAELEGMLSEAEVNETALFNRKNFFDAQELAAETKLSYEESWNAITSYLVATMGLPKAKALVLRLENEYNKIIREYIVNEAKGQTISTEEAREYAESWEEDDVLDGFDETFSNQEEVTKSEFMDFFEGWIDDMADMDYVRDAWKKLSSGEGLYEAKGDEEVTDDVTTDDVAVDDTETIDTTITTEVNPDVKAVQDSLTQAQAAAQKLGDPKLTDQIGNTITFFTRSHVVEKPNSVAEGDEMEEAMIPIEPGDSDYDIGYRTFFVYEDRIGGFGIENIKKVGMVLANKIKNDNKIKNTDEFFRGFMDSWNESSDSTADKEDMYEAKKPVNEVMFPMLKRILK